MGQRDHSGQREVSFHQRQCCWLGCNCFESSGNAVHGHQRMRTYSVGGLNEGVVDSNDLDVGVIDGVAEDDTTDTAKSVNADLDHFD